MATKTEDTHTGASMKGKEQEQEPEREEGVTEEKTAESGVRCPMEEQIASHVTVGGEAVTSPAKNKQDEEAINPPKQDVKIVFMTARNQLQPNSQSAKARLPEAGPSSKKLAVELDPLRSTDSSENPLQRGKQSELSKEEKKQAAGGNLAPYLLDIEQSDPNCAIPMTSLHRGSGQVIAAGFDDGVPGAFAQGYERRGMVDGSGGTLQYSNGYLDFDSDPELGELGNLGNFRNVCRLMVANPVVSMDRRSNLPRATEFVPRNEKQPSSCQSSKRLILFVIAVAVIVAAVVVGSVLLRGNDKMSSDGKEEDEQVPSPPKQVYLLDLPDYTIQAFQNPQSPQSKAYEWLINDPSFNSYPLQRQHARFALATLYYALDGPSWIVNQHWLSYNVSECEWHSKLHSFGGHPSCDEEGNFLGVSFASNGLRGTLPPELSMITTMEQLSIADGDIRGGIPTELGLLSNLGFFLLVNLPLVGRVPSEVGQLTGLHHFIVQDTQLSGQLPTEIGLWSSPRGPPKKINFSYNQGAGILPTEIGLVQGLQSLRLFGKGEEAAAVVVLPTEIGMLNRLQRMEVDDCGYKGGLPSQLGNLVKLNTLSLAGNKFTGIIPEEVHALRNLQTLNLANNYLTGTVPKGLDQLLSLELLTVEGNELSGRLPPSIVTNLVNLTTLHLNDTFITGTIPGVTCEQITSISIDCPNVCGCGCPCL